MCGFFVALDGRHKLCYHSGRVIEPWWLGQNRTLQTERKEHKRWNRSFWRFRWRWSWPRQSWSRSWSWVLWFCACPHDSVLCHGWVSSWLRRSRRLSLPWPASVWRGESGYGTSPSRSESIAADLSATATSFSRMMRLVSFSKLR